MKHMRRVVTGHNPAGRAVFASDQQVAVQPVPGMPELEFCMLWGSDATMSYPDDGSPKPAKDMFPPVGGFRYLMFTVAPERQAAQQPRQASHQELKDAIPSLADTMQEDHPGMHRSETVDLLYVISGRCVLELDDGAKIELRAGDTAVQSGTMHAWRNPYDEPCRLIAAVIGARQQR